LNFICTIESTLNRMYDWVQVQKGSGAVHER